MADVEQKFTQLATWGAPIVRFLNIFLVFTSLNNFFFKSKFR